MKICDNCGHRNFSATVKLGQKQPMCEKCNKPLADKAECRPRNGVKVYGGGYRCSKLPDSDERGF